MRLLLVVLFLVPVIVIPIFFLSRASASDEVAGSATVLNTSNKIYFTSTEYNANVSISELDAGTNKRTISGYAWSEDVGWIQFTAEQGRTSGVFVNYATGKIEGSAYVINTGYLISFDGYNSNAKVDTNTGAFSGFVWSENLGWIDFGDREVFIRIPYDSRREEIEGEATVLNTSNKIYFSSSEYNAKVVISMPDGDNDKKRMILGYAWSEDLGWIKFTPEDGQTTGVFVKYPSGSLEGSAYVISTGHKIIFDDYNSNAKVDIATGVFSGYAWSENVGWIDFGDGDVYINVFPEPTDLLCEEETNPKKVTTLTPSLSAIFKGIYIYDTTEYYQIEVNTSPTFDGTTVWDSGVEEMDSTKHEDRSPDIEYDGSPLSFNGNKYYWRIRFVKSYDVDDYEVLGAWSTTEASFTMSGPPEVSILHTSSAIDPNIVTLPPYFSAIYTDPNEDNAAYYQVQVNTSSNFNGTTMWDSGKTAMTVISGERSSRVPYNGAALSYNGTTYYVRMRFWDIDDNVSNWTTGQFTDNPNRMGFEGVRLEGVRVD